MGRFHPGGKYGKNSGVGAIEILSTNPTDHSQPENTKGLLQSCISGCLGRAVISRHAVGGTILQRVAIIYD